MNPRCTGNVQEMYGSRAGPVAKERCQQATHECKSRTRANFFFDDETRGPGIRRSHVQRAFRDYDKTAPPLFVAMINDRGVFAAGPRSHSTRAIAQKAFDLSKHPPVRYMSMTMHPRTGGDHERHRFRKRPNRAGQALIVGTVPSGSWLKPA